MAGLFSGMSEESNFQKMAALAARESDPYAKLGIMLGTMLGGAMGSGMQSEKEIAQAWMLENGQNIDWNDPNSLKEAAAKAQPYSPELAGNLIQESFSLSRELAKAAAAATKDRDVSPMTDKNADSIEKFLSSKEIEGGTENYGLINDIHTWSQKKNWTYDQALEYLLNTKYQSLASDSWFGRDYKVTPRDGEGTAAAIQQPTVGNREEEARKNIQALTAEFQRQQTGK